MRRILVGLSVVGLVACGGGASPPDGASQPDPRGYDALAYELVGSFDWSTRELTARETITVAALPGQQTIELDTRVQVDRVAGAGGAALGFAQDLGAGRLDVDLGAAAATGPVVFTVDYHVATSDALLAATGRDDDPVKSRVVFTDSEPDRARSWLVAHDHPSDRATWAVELTVPADEDVVANGVRVRDEVHGSSRTVRYELDQPIPTYIMAFAAGQLDHADRAGTVPLSLWYRRGLVVDAERHLDMLAQLIPRFEQLLGPYPWPSYGVFLAPFPFANGGMENAGITFNQESLGQGNISLSVNAHELGHQWYGDWVTMNDYQDVWFKEGMATVLEAEGQRGVRGAASPARKFGQDFGFAPGDAIVDPTLTGLARYTTGPYQRAAWLITQIRARIGEDAFWAALRAMLADNALGTLSGPRFLQGFAPMLSSGEIAQLTQTLEQTATPAIDFAIADLANQDRTVTLALHDPHHQLLVPLDVTVVDAAGTATTSQIAPGASATVTVPAGGYLAPDEIDVGPPWTRSYGLDSTTYYTTFAKLLVPSATGALAAFLDRSPAHQERASSDYGVPPIAPGDVPGFYAGLDSTIARRNIEHAVCSIIGFGQPDQASWVALIPTFFARPAVEAFSTAYATCGPIAADLAAELASRVDAVTVHSAPRVAFLMSFDYGPDASLALIGKLATSAPSLVLREQALSRLAAQVRTGAGYSPILDPAPWRALFRDQLSRAETTQRFSIVWRAALGLSDRGALPIVAARLHVYALDPAHQRQVVCDAHALTGGDADWQAFRDATLPWDTLSTQAQAVLQDPAGCAAAARAGVGPQPRWKPL